MFNKNFAIPIILLLVLFSLSFASSVPPVQISEQLGALEIAYPQYQFVPINTNFTLSIHVFNVSDYITGNTADCYVDLYDEMGIETASEHMSMGGSDYYSFIYAGNFSGKGEHSFIIFCNTTSQTGFASGIFEVTHSGLELTSGRAIIDTTLIFILLSFFVICLFVFFNGEGLLIKVSMIGMGYLLLLSISFVAWNVAEDFVISNTFIIAFFRIIFFVLMVGAFPLLIGGFIFYFLMLFKIKEIQRLMDKGFTEHDARRRVK